MSAHADYVGAEGQSYPEVAARAVQSVHAQNRSPLYGYIRSGVNQKIYLFPRLEDARAWFDQHVQLHPDHDYAAVFSASNLRAPIAGMEHFQRANVSGDHVGSLWPFLLGLPLGGLGGYFLRRWQEPAGTQVVPLREAVRPLLPGQQPAPKTAGEYVGGPWLDLVGQDLDGYNNGYGGYSIGCPPGVGGYSIGCPPGVGGPWLDLTGQDYNDGDDGSGGYSVGCPPLVGAVDAWPQTKALIQSAIDDVTREAANHPAEAYVWVLDAPTSASYAGRTEGSVVTLEGTTNVVPFSSQGEALNYLREVAQTRPVALAMFERSSAHWPNPVAWRKSREPEHESVIAQRVANRSPTQTSGTYTGADTMVGAAVDDVRRRAQALAERRAGNVIGVIHTSKDGLWHVLAFRTADDADDWLGTATQEPASYTYAAYYDKQDFQWPHPVNEKIGGTQAPSRPGSIRREVGTTSGEWMP